MRTLLIITALAMGATGCSFHARSAADYEKVTRELLASREADVQSCYQKKAKKDETLQGAVVVKFEVEAKTGNIINAKAAKKSDAPEPLQKCVLKSLEGLTLDPPDQRTGKATNTYEFNVVSE